MGKKKPKLQWSVPYRVTLEGYVTVEAETAEEARALATEGGYDIEPGAECVDWEVTGTPTDAGA